MAHEIYWMRPNRILYVSYQGHQTPQTLRLCLDDMAAHLDTVTESVIILINWLEVTQADPGVLRSNHGHRVYGHPMAGRGILVGFDRQEAFENEVTSVKTRGDKNTQYYNTMEDALRFLKFLLD